MLRKTLTIPALSALLLTGGLFTQTSCNNAQQTEMAADKDQAYNDFQTFVSDTESRAEAAANATEDDYNRETTQMKADFDSRVAAVDKYADQYDDTRRQEIEQLRNRYTTAYDKREASWSSRSAGDMQLGKYYKPSSPASRLTAANARQTYESFVKDIKQNEDRYDINDWRNINAEWRALDEAYDKVKGDIAVNDLAEIQKEKLKYAAFKSFDKAEARTAQGADAIGAAANEVANETQDERSAVGRAASNTASDVKEAGKDVGQGAANVGSKVGSAVKGAYKEVKSEVKNTDND
ncbi:hypothetical protein J7E24_15490 [Hymenobacter sp. ISL-91]|uniref:DUF6565 domain-containing protein n=1 Tax=Hymenobacter sp. ISL-91 TaxID=2819151 RepID=UPI001BEB4247|nr:DUF6565 domain-containing protein [Hymenobacter sp. ISL-91]MBT2559193.1 hypothetical protein [Hymenobacter sp. ISL-91]